MGNEQENDRLISSSEKPPTEAPRGKRGPKTTAGKEKVSFNAVKAGLTSLRAVLPGESSADWETHRRNIIDALEPVDAVDMALAEQVASILWRLRRVTAYEIAVIDERRDLKEVSARLLPGAIDLDKIVRYEAHLRRLLFQALHELEARRAERRGQPAPILRIDVNKQAGTFDDGERA